MGEVLPLVLDSPHSGNTRPDGWHPIAPRAALESGWDAYVNDPYKGAELILRHSDPAGGRHAIQIEVNRALYMDEAERTRRPDFAAFAAVLDRFVAQLAGFVRSALAS